MHLDCRSRPDASASSIEQMVSWKAYAYSFAALVAASYYYFPAASAGGSSGGTTIDGLSFPAALKMGGVAQTLTGGGTRTKYGVAKVYALALYIDSAGGASSLSKFAGAAPTKEPKFYSALIDGSCESTALRDRTQPFIRPMISLTLLVYFFYVRSRAHARSAVPPLCHLRRDGECPRRGDGQAPLQR